MSTLNCRERCGGYLVLVQSVSFNFTYSSPGLLAGGSVRSNLALDDSERLKRKENKFYVKQKNIIEITELTPISLFS